jgi:hypothetical protein
MTFDDLEESLSEILPSSFRIEPNKKGQLIVFTGLACDDDGEITDFVSDEDEDEDLEDLDEDLVPLEDDDDEE